MLSARIKQPGLISAPGVFDMRFRPPFEQVLAVMPSAERIVQPQPQRITACSAAKTRETPQNQRNPFIAHTAAS